MKRVLLTVIIVIVGLLIYLFMPLSSKQYKIEFDQEKINYKQKFLSKASSSHGSGKSVPNIIIITADDLGKTDISLYGGKTVDTPNIDTIGDEGIIFTEAYCNSPICSPSRAGMLTGRYVQRYGYELQPHDRYPKNRLEYLIVRHFMDRGDWIVAEHNGYPLQEDIDKQGVPPSEITLGELLKSRGYKTGIIGKWHLGHNEPFLPNNRGFEYQYGFYEAFSLYAPVDSPDIINHRHDYSASKHIWGKGRSDTCAIRRNNEVIEEKEYLTQKIAAEAVRYLVAHKDEPFFLYVPFNAPHTPFQVTKEYFDKFSHVKDRNKRVYYAMIAALDDAVGEITNKVKELDIEEKTIIFFASDNGGAVYTGATDNAPLKGGKLSNFEGGLNIPCMVKWKGKLPEGKHFHEPVSLMDLFVTSAEISGSTLPDDRQYEGVNLIPYVTGENDGIPHEALYWRSGYNKAIRRGQWKLIMNERDEITILYNLKDDKVEKKNIAASHPEIVENLKKEHKAWEEKLGEPAWPRILDFRFRIGDEVYFYAI